MPDMGSGGTGPREGCPQSPSRLGGGRRQVPGRETGALKFLHLEARKLLSAQRSWEKSHLIKTKEAEKRQPGDPERL